MHEEEIPRKASDPYRSITIKLRRDAAFTGEMEALCERLGVSMSALTRQALIGKLKRDGYLKEEERSERLLRRSMKVYGVKEEAQPDESKRPEGTATKRGATTAQDRVEAVCFCLACGDYGRTAKRFGVNYGQVYDWMKRYREKGVSGLEFTRGKRMPGGQLTQAQREEAKRLLALAQEQGKARAQALRREMNALETGGAGVCGGGAGKR